MYTELYLKWKNKAEEEINPSNDCLGIARNVICAHKYVYCEKYGENRTNDGYRPGVCQFLCKLWENRYIFSKIYLLEIIHLKMKKKTINNAFCKIKNLK